LRIILVPWLKSWVFALRIYVDDGGIIWPDDYRAEISTLKGQMLALSLIQKHAESVRLTVPDFISCRLAVEAKIQEEVAERLLFALKRLGDISSSRKIPESLIENPTLEGLESFLSINRLIS